MQTPTPPTPQSRVVNPDMIIVGRESRGLSQKELADRLRTTQGRVSKVESGLLAVPDELLDDLSRVLGYPQNFFFQGDPLMGVGMAELFHRKKQDVPKKTLDRIYAEIEIRTRHMDALLRAMDIPCALQHIDVEDYGGAPEEVARLVRATWHIPRGPIMDLTHTVEDVGVIVLPFDFGTRHVDAISRWVRSLPPLVFANDTAPKDRFRWSLAHEIGHLVMHSTPTPDIEEQADRFAAELLMPEREIRPDLRNLTLPRLAQLKQYWRVSMNALLKRAQDLGAITENQGRYLWAQMAKAGYRTREPVELDVAGERAQLVRELIDAHRKNLGYSTSDLSGMLALYESDFHAWYMDEQTQTLKLIVGQAKRSASATSTESPEQTHSTR